VAFLEELTSVYPAPTFIRFDNGPDFITQALQDLCGANVNTSTAYIEPGCLWMNAIADSFNGRFEMSYSTPSCSRQLPKLNS